MKNILENPVERRVVDDARFRYGILSVKLKNNADSGWPDRQFFIPMNPLLMEFKRSKGGVLSPKQDKRFADLRLLGYAVVVCDSYDQAMAHIEQHREKSLCL